MIAMDQMSALDCLNSLPGVDARRLREAMQRRELAAGEEIPAGEAGSNVCWLANGLVREYRVAPDGSELTLDYAKPGSLLAGGSLLTGQPPRDCVRAVKDSSIWSIPRDLFLELAASHPALGLEVARQAAKRLDRVESRLESLVFGDVMMRVARVLVDLVTDFGEREGGLLTFDLPLTQAELATWIGTSRQSVNASLGALEDDGLIGRQRRRIVIYKPEELSRRAGQLAAS